jgi:DNA polymerase
MAKKSERQLERLHHGIRRCRKCPLHRGRTHAVPGEGHPHARLMLIGEAPGEKEDLEGRPFCGRTKKFFDDLLHSNGLGRDEIFLTSSVKCRPPDNRNPKSEEWTTCGEHWLKRQIDLIDPRLILLLGKIAIRQSLGETANLKDVHGQVRERDGRRYMLTYHPTAGMRFPIVEKAMREDFRRLQGMLANL